MLLKKIVRTTIVIVWGIYSPISLFSQNINLYLIKENITAVTTNSELIVSDQLNTSCTNPSKAELYNDETKNIFINMESSITPTSKFLMIPFGYTLKKKYSISVMLPYYFSRGMNYSHGTEMTSGIGDLSVKATYKHNNEKLKNEFSLLVKLPTGNANKQVNGYLVPLGTGTTDIMGQTILTYESNKNKLYFNLSFRLNGKLERKAQITYPAGAGVETIKYNIKNGNTFMFYSSYSYKFWKYASGLAGFSVIKNGQGAIDQTQSLDNGPTLSFNGMNAGQSFFIADFNPAIIISIKKFDIALGCKIPAYTKVSEINSEDKRKLMYTFRFSYSIY